MVDISTVDELTNCYIYIYMGVMGLVSILMVYGWLWLMKNERKVYGCLLIFTQWFMDELWSIDVYRRYGWYIHTY